MTSSFYDSLAGLAAEGASFVIKKGLPSPLNGSPGADRPPRISLDPHEIEDPVAGAMRTIASIGIPPNEIIQAVVYREVAQWAGKKAQELYGEGFHAHALATPPAPSWGVIAGIGAVVLILGYVAGRLDGARSWR